MARQNTGGEVTEDMAAVDEALKNMPQNTEASEEFSVDEQLIHEHNPHVAHVTGHYGLDEELDALQITLLSSAAALILLLIQGGRDDELIGVIAKTLFINQDGKSTKDVGEALANYSRNLKWLASFGLALTTEAQEAITNA